jgi:hypothetical protein
MLGSSLHELIFWGIWVVAAAAVLALLRHFLPEKHPVRRRTPIAASSLASYATTNSHPVEIEAELALYLGADLEPTLNDLSWAEVQAGRLNIRDIETLDALLSRHRAVILKFAGKFEWNKLARGDALRLLFHVLGAELGKDRYNELMRGAANPFGGTDIVFRAFEAARSSASPTALPAAPPVDRDGLKRIVAEGQERGLQNRPAQRAGFDDDVTRQEVAGVRPQEVDGLAHPVEVAADEQESADPLKTLRRAFGGGRA